MTFYPAIIKSIDQLTTSAANIVLEVSPEVRAKFSFKAGQYLVLRIPDLDPSLHRSYSISAAPSEGVLQIGVKAVHAGVVSPYLTARAKIGDRIDILEPTGSFIIPQDIKPKNIVAFAAGSGITPVLSILKDQLESNPDVRITLFYGNKDSFSRMYHLELENLMRNHGARLEINYIYSRQKTGLASFEGRIDSAKINSWKEYLFNPSSTDLYLLCGPGDMVSTLEKSLQQLGAKKEIILTEYFTPPDASIESIPTPADNKQHLIKIKYNKKWSEFAVNNNQDVILDLGIRNGLDLPYSCKSGVCSTCQAKLLKGEVRMDNNYVLSDKELQQGFILTCQSHPVTAEIEVDYDMR